MSEEIAEPGEGNSPAAWTAVIVMLIAFAIGTFAFVLAITWLFWVGVVLLVLGALSGLVLAKAGYGVRGPKFVPKHH